MEHAEAENSTDQPAADAPPPELRLTEERCTEWTALRVQAEAHGVIFRRTTEGVTVLIQGGVLFSLLKYLRKTEGLNASLKAFQFIQLLVCGDSSKILSDEMCFKSKPGQPSAVPNHVSRFANTLYRTISNLKDKIARQV